jgi:RNA polymerase subunit RPABC4/transcription elongation factor Spt4
MLYCPKCQLLISDSSQRCPFCGSKKLRKPEPEDPALLITADENKTRAIEAVFKENKIIYRKRIAKGFVGLNKLNFGKDYLTNYNIFVSYGDIENCSELLHGAGIVDEVNKQNENNGSEEEFEDMSPRKRFFWRTFSAILFIIVVWIVVFAADYVVDIIKEILKKL